jgi:hypothetical protein
VVALVSACLLTACGSNESSNVAGSTAPTPDVSATEQTSSDDLTMWAGQICVAFDGWEEDAVYFGDRLQTEIDANPVPAQGKELIAEFLDAMMLSTRNFIDDVDAAGTPPVKDGQAISAALDTGLKRAFGAFLQARSLAETLPTGNRRQFVAATERLNGVTGRAVTEIETTIESINRDYDTTELSDAFEAAPEC